MILTASAHQANKWYEQLLSVANQLGGLSDDAALCRHKGGAALIEDDLDDSRHVANFFPRGS